MAVPPERRNAPSKPFRPRGGLFDDSVLDAETKRSILEDIQRSRAPAGRLGATAAHGSSEETQTQPDDAGTAARGNGAQAAAQLLQQPAGAGRARGDVSGNARATGALSSRPAVNLNRRPDAGPSVCSGNGVAPAPAVLPQATKASDVVDTDLVDVMASRLRFLEKQVATLQKEVKDKSLRLCDAQNNPWAARCTSRHRAAAWPNARSATFRT